MLSLGKRTMETMIRYPHKGQTPDCRVQISFRSMHMSGLEKCQDMRVLLSFLHINRKPVIFSHQLQISAYRLTTIETVVVLRDKKVDGHIGIDLDVSKLGIKPER